MGHRESVTLQIKEKVQVHSGALLKKSIYKVSTVHCPLSTAPLKKRV